MTSRRPVLLAFAAAGLALAPAAQAATYTQHDFRVANLGGTIQRTSDVSFSAVLTAPLVQDGWTLRWEDKYKLLQHCQSGSQTIAQTGTFGWPYPRSVAKQYTVTPLKSGGVRYTIEVTEDPANDPDIAPGGPGGTRSICPAGTTAIDLIAVTKTSMELYPTIDGSAPPEDVMDVPGRPISKSPG